MAGESGRVTSVSVTIELEGWGLERIERHYTGQPLDEAGLRSLKELLGHRVFVSAARAMHLDAQIKQEERALSQRRTDKFSGGDDGTTGT